jgi:hypothetical protein
MMKIGLLAFTSTVHFTLVKKDTENVYAPLVIVSILGRKRTLADTTVYQNGSIETSFDTPLFSFDSTFKFDFRGN